MIGIGSTSYYLAQATNTVSEWCALQGLPAERCAALLRNGADGYHFATREGLYDLAAGAVARLLASAHLDGDAVDALVVCHTSPLNVLPMPYTLAGALREACNLRGAYAFSVTQQQCVSPLHALRVLDHLFQTHRQWQHAIIVAADIVLREEFRAIGEAGIHSDAGSAMLVHRQAASSIRGLCTYNDPRTVQESLPTTLYEDNANYVWTLVSVIRRILKGAAVAPAQLTSVIPHNVNLTAWRQVLNALNVPPERLFQENFGRIGHAFGSDVAINIHDASALKTPGEHLVFTAGIGACFGGFVLKTEAEA